MEKVTRVPEANPSLVPATWLAPLNWVRAEKSRSTERGLVAPLVRAMERGEPVAALYWPEASKVTVPLLLVEAALSLGSVWACQLQLLAPVLVKVSLMEWRTPRES